MLSSTTDWFWDFWHVADGERHHLFFLRAPRALGDPELRHWNVRIGHATSTDLVEWREHADALAPAPTPAWDDCTTWTGSVIRADGCWQLFYTGTSRAEQGLVQRVGRAVSTDLEHWERVGDGLAFELDRRWYEEYDGAWHDQAWRDPRPVWLAGEWHVLVTARLREGPMSRRGTIGVARSADLRTWRAGAPLTGLTPFGQLEIPDVVELGGTWFLLFASTTGMGDPAADPAAAQSGTWAVPSVGGPLGPWRWEDVHLVIGDGWYGSKIIPAGVAGDGPPVLLAWREREADGGFGGWIGDPLPVAVSDGRIVVERR